MEYLWLIAGLGLLAAGGEMLVRGGVALAHRLGIPTLLIGFTVVSAGTSSPELLVSLQSAVENRLGFATGNVLGANMMTLMLALGLAALVAPVVVDRSDIRGDAWMLIVASSLMVLAAIFGVMGRLFGAVMLAGLSAYNAFAYGKERRRRSTRPDWREEEVEQLETPMRTSSAIVLLVAGLVGLSYGSDVLISQAAALAGDLGVSDETIGLSVVALGTALPELVTSIVASYRGHPDVAVGNVLGSNVFNVMFVLGATALVRPVPVAAALIPDSVLVLLTASLVAALLLARGRITRLQGFVLVSIYAVYVGWLIMRS